MFNAHFANVEHVFVKCSTCIWKVFDVYLEKVHIYEEKSLYLDFFYISFKKEIRNAKENRKNKSKKGKKEKIQINVIIRSKRQ